jgi:hypothetical protein
MNGPVQPRKRLQGKITKASRVRSRPWTPDASDKARTQSGDRGSSPKTEAEIDQCGIAEKEKGKGVAVGDQFEDSQAQTEGENGGHTP